MKLTHRAVTQRTKVDKETLRGLQEASKKFNFQFTSRQLSAVAIPNGIKSIWAYTWMAKHFGMIGDEQPGRAYELYILFIIYIA